MATLVLHVQAWQQTCMCTTPLHTCLDVHCDWLLHHEAPSGHYIAVAIWSGNGQLRILCKACMPLPPLRTMQSYLNLLTTYHWKVRGQLAGGVNCMQLIQDTGLVPAVP